MKLTRLWLYVLFKFVFRTDGEIVTYNGVHVGC
jgi:hypothetical protein